MIRHPAVIPNCLPSSLVHGLPVHWESLPDSPLRVSLASAILFAGGESCEPGWTTGVLTAQWNYFGRGTLVVSNTTHHDAPYTWLIAGRPEALWDFAPCVDLRTAFGHSLVFEHHWPDWLLFSPRGPVRAFDPHERGHTTWRSLETLLGAYHFAEHPHVIAALSDAAADAARSSR